MGFYNDGNIYGVRWIIWDELNNDTVVKEWEKKSLTKLQFQEIQEIKKEYEKLSNDEIKECSIYFYSCCSDTYCEEPYMMWIQGNKTQLEELFEKGDTVI